MTAPILVEPSTNVLRKRWLLLRRIVLLDGQVRQCQARGLMMSRACTEWTDSTYSTVPHCQRAGTTARLHVGLSISCPYGLERQYGLQQM